MSGISEGLTGPTQLFGLTFIILSAILFSLSEIDDWDVQVLLKTPPNKGGVLVHQLCLPTVHSSEWDTSSAVLQSSWELGSAVS